MSICHVLFLKAVLMNDIIRVLHVFYGDNIAGGGSFSMLYLCEGLKSMDNIDVQAIVPFTKEREMSSLLEEKKIKSHNLSVPWMVHERRSRETLKNRVASLYHTIERQRTDREIARIIEHEHINIVHIGGAVIDVGLRPAMKMGVPVVWHFREFVERDHDLVYYNKARAFAEYARASQCITVSNAVTDYYQSLLPGTPINTVYNGMIFQGEFARSAYSVNKRPAPEGVWRMAFFSGLKRTKGIADLLQGLVEFRNNSDVRFKLDIFGRASDEELSRMQNFLQANNLRDYVDFKGWSKVDSQLMSNYDIVFTCSRSEAFGRVTADAMCNGVLVIGADTGGTKELLTAGGGRPLYIRQSDVSRGRYLQCHLRTSGLQNYNCKCVLLRERAFFSRGVCVECGEALQAGARQ